MTQKKGQLGAQTRKWVSLVGVAGLALGAGCGDDKEINTPAQDTSLFDGDGSFPDVDSFVPEDTGATDTSGPDSDSTGSDTSSPADVADTREDTQMPDLTPDLTPPTVVSVSPADGARNVSLPLEVRLTFSEDLLAQTVASASVKLLDSNNQEVPGTPELLGDNKTVVWRPSNNNQAYVSEYKIRVLGSIIKDYAGNPLASNFESTFTTQNFPAQAKYAALAAAYAPDIYSGTVDGTSAQFQVPVRMDFDGDWNFSNNRTALAASTEIKPAVYYTVSETFTHYFIQYSYYFPYINHSIDLWVTGNGLTSVLVVVEKARGTTEQRPIAAYTLWKNGTEQPNFAFVTEEGQIAPNSQDWATNWKASEEAVFPEGRFQSFIAARTHNHCHWAWNQSGTNAHCAVNDSVRQSPHLVFKYNNGQVDTYAKTGNSWPVSMADLPGEPEALGYELVPLFETLWPLRAHRDAESPFTPDRFTYSETGRPGAGTSHAAQFIQSFASADMSSYGRPPWAFGWAQSGVSTFNMQQGTSGLDPAWYVWRRHHRSSNPVNSVVPYDAASGQGFATEYCFNGFAALDQRGSNPKCPQ